MEFERVLKEIGGYGLFSKTVITAAVVLGTWHSVICYLGHVLVLVAPPSQWCFGKGVTHGGEVLDVTSLPRGRCQFVDETADATESGNRANTTTHQYTGATCPTGWTYDNTEFFTSITMENEWICGDNWKMYATHTSYWIGSMVGCLISGFLADRLGRKKTILILLVIGGSGNAFSALFSSFAGFTTLRMVTGLGAGTVCSATFVAAIEFTVSHRRSLITLTFAMSWSCLAAALPYFGYLVQSWRILLLTATVVDFMLAALVCFWVPESPRWLLSVGRKEEALASLERISRINGKEVSRETLNKLLLLQETNEENDVKVISSKKPPSFLQTTLLLVKSPRIRRLTIFIYFAWFVITLCYNVITLQLGRLDLNIYSTYAIAIAFELPVNALCLVLMDTVGRRWSNTGFLLISTVACFLLGFLRPESSTWTLVLAVAAIMAMAGAYNVTNQLAPEAFPTVIRGRAVLLQKLIGDVGGLVGIQVASLVECDMYTPVLVMAALSLAATVVVFFLPETLEQALPQSIEDGENFGKDQTLCFCPISVAKRARKNRSLEKQARRTARSSNEDELGTVVTPLAGDSTV
ncbi:solute carrier family 22 member 7-like isoform X1 [Rhipicephalus microplus]|uniref:solute carrier family 22 member 7-like isoform X1 n=1 Tax=Rhipicephalus microplus TaxID=6941 RepID=UPI003F6D59DE